MISSKKIELTKETEEIIKGMTEAEKDAFLDLISVLVSVKQSPGEDLIPIMEKVMNEQAAKFVQTKKQDGDRVFAKEKIDRDMESRLAAAKIPIPPPVMQDASTILETVVRRKMLEDPSLSYGEALSQAQLENRELALRIKGELDAYRHRNDKPRF